MLATLRVERPPIGLRPLRVVTIPVGPFPSTVAVGAGAVWVGTGAGVARIDPATNRVVARLRVGPVGGEGPCGVAVGEGGVWIVRGFPGEVLRVDPATNRVVARIRLPGAGCLAAGHGGLWVATRRSVRRIDPRTNRLSGPPIAVRGSPQGIAVSPRGVWVASGFGDERSRGSLPPGTRGRPVGVVSRIDPGTGAVAIARAVPRFPEHVAEGAGQVWLTSNDGSAARVDPRTGVVVRRAQVAGGGRTRIAVGLGALWGANVAGPGARHSVTRLGLSRRQTFPPVAVGSSPVALATGAGSVWVANFNSGTISRIDP